jgi:NADH-quinone oxidoreductase subunit J
MSLTFSGAVYYLFAAILVFAALRVVTVKNPVQAALFLVLAFFSAAAIWMLLKAEFLAVALVLVYVGAVMVLFLFVVMMLDINVDSLREGFKKAIPVSMLVGALIIAEMVMVLMAAMKRPVGSAAMPIDTGSNTKALGMVLYTHYVYVFELAAVVLLVAIIAAIALTHRKRAETKVQNPSEQVKVKKADRVRVLKMESSILHKTEETAPQGSTQNTAAPVIPAAQNAPIPANVAKTGA